jgi:hypothetical protein
MASRDLATARSLRRQQFIPAIVNSQQQAQLHDVIVKTRKINSTRKDLSWIRHR